MNTIHSLELTIAGYVVFSPLIFILARIVMPEDGEA